MNYEQVLKYYGGSVEKLRHVFTPPITHQAIYKWKKEGVIPLKRQYTFHLDSKGKLKIGL